MMKHEVIELIEMAIERRFKELQESLEAKTTEMLEALAEEFRAAGEQEE